MNKTKWIERKFELNLPQDEFISVLRRLSETPGKIEKLIHLQEPGILTKKDGDSWSIQMHIGHLIDLEELHDGRINDFIEKKEVLRAADMRNKKTEDANHNQKDIEDLIVKLKEARKNFVNRFKELDDEVLTHVSIHPRLDQSMRPVDMAYFVAEHDEHHINSMIDLLKKFSFKA